MILVIEEGPKYNKIRIDFRPNSHSWKSFEVIIVFCLCEG